MYQDYFERYLRFPPDQHGTERKCHCPRPERHSNGDKNASASVNIEKGLFSCFVCGLEGNVYQLAKELGWEDPPRPAASGWSGLPESWKDRPILDRYSYKDEDGTVLFYVCRVEYNGDGKRQKEFPIHDPYGRWGLKAKPGVREHSIEQVLYNLPEIVEAEDIFICEGEKDCRTLKTMGLVATSSPGGAGKWRDVYGKHLTGKHVTILADNDAPGRQHASQAAESIHHLTASLKVLEFADLPEGGDVSDWAEGRDPAEAKKELCRLVEQAPEWTAEKTAVSSGWKLYDIGTLHEVQVEPLAWIVDSLIPEKGIGFLSGAPKDGKTLLALDMCIHLAHVKPWLGRYSTEAHRTLYIAREDPLRRLKERVGEINSSYDYPALTKEAVFFLVRERFSLMNPDHLDWLRGQVEEREITFLICDVLNRMIPELDEISAKDMAELVSVLEELNRELSLTILLLDHTRKPQGPGSGRNKQHPNPFDLKGSVAKYGAADFMLCLSRTEEPGRLQLYCENKDTDIQPHFFLDVSPKDSGEPKFTWAGDVTQLAADRKALGHANRVKVLAEMGDGWVTVGELMESTELSRSAVKNHLKRLEEAEKAERSGTGRHTRWRLLMVETEEPL